MYDFSKLKRKMYKRQQRGKKGVPGVIRALQIFSIFLFILVLFFTFLSVIASEKSLRKMSRVYVDSVEIDTQYFDGYYKYDFTEDMCKNFLEGEEMKKLTSEILTERLLAIFHNTKEFKFTEDGTKDVIRGEIKRVAEENNINLTDEGIEALTNYTCDISGISTMFKFNTPAQYRTAIYDADRESIDYINKFLIGLSKVSSPLFPMFMLLLYMISVAILIFLGYKLDLSMPVANTSLYPSIAIFAFSIGEIFMPDASVVTDYLFRKVLLVSGAGIVFGIMVMIIYKYLFTHIGEKE